MRSNYGKHYLVALFFIVLVINTIDLTIIQSTPLGTQSSLPDPLPVYMTVETSIFRRGSMRDYSTEQITEEELSTILWAAYGFTSDTTRTISPINERFGIHGNVQEWILWDTAQGSTNRTGIHSDTNTYFGIY